MRNTSETQKERNPEIRATVVVDRRLIDEFRLIAKRNQRTFSGEVRKMIEDAVEAERERERRAA